MDGFDLSEKQANEYMKCWYREKRKKKEPLSRLMDSNQYDSFDHLLYSANTLIYAEWKIREEPSAKHRTWLIEEAKVVNLRAIHQAHLALNKMQAHYQPEMQPSPPPLILFFNLCSDGKLYIFDLMKPPNFKETRKAKAQTKDVNSKIIDKKFWFYSASQAIETFQFPTTTTTK